MFCGYMTHRVMIHCEAMEANMLVLTQREGEILQIGEDVRIYIKRIRGGSVRLCIDAPDDVALQRIPVPEAPEAQQQEEERRSKRQSVSDVEVVRLSRRR